jgi:hypothetical protein
VKVTQKVHKMKRSWSKRDSDGVDEDDQEERDDRNVRQRSLVSGKSSSSNRPVPKELFTAKYNSNTSGPTRQLFTNKVKKAIDDPAVVRVDNLRWDNTSESLKKTFSQHNILGWKSVKVMEIHGQASYALLEFQQRSRAERFVRDHNQKVRVQHQQANS